MALLEIVNVPNEVLRAKTQPVKNFDAELQQLIDDMIETMRDANGVGLAAPQIGRSLSLAVVETLSAVDEEGNEIPDSRELHVIVNPKIIWHSDTVVDGIEGCLSIPGYLGEVERSESILVRAKDRNGKKVKLKLSGWDARIFQHEIDHLDGVLYIDRLTAPEHMWTEAEFEAMLEAQQVIDEAVAEAEESMAS